jgi:hypothetical protein
MGRIDDPVFRRPSRTCCDFNRMIEIVRL